MKQLARAAVALGVAATAATIAYGCGKGGGNPGEAPAGGSANGGALGISGSVGRGIGVSGRAMHTWPSDGGAGASSGDPGWQSVTWAPCEAEVASRPEYAVPALEWQACDGISGCERLVVNWRSSITTPFQHASLFKSGNRVLLSLHMWFDGEWRKAVYENARTPLAAWRAPIEGGGCGGPFTATTASRVCLLLGLQTQAKGAALPLADPAGEPILSFDTNAVGSDGCTDQILTSYTGDGAYFVFAQADGLQHSIVPPAGRVFGLRPFADVVFFNRFDPTGDNEVMDGWIWSVDGGARRLIRPSGDSLIYDVRGDGRDLAWLEMPFTTDYQAKIAGALWASPYATDEASVERRMLRAVPETSIWPGGKVLNGGYYALVEQHEDPSVRQQPHVYRLADGRHWAVPVPSGFQANDALHVDQDELWYVGLSTSDGGRTVVRQRLSPLGEGD